MSSDVYVVGGGPAGLAAAIAARLRGFDVALSDPARPPIDKACGEGILPAGVAAARALGLDLPGAPLRGISFHDGPRSATATFPHGHGLGLRRTDLHAALADRARSLGVRLHWGHRVASLDALRARWIVGADGAQSLVRRWAGLDAVHRDTRRYGFRRHYAVAPWSDRVEIWWADRFQLYFTPIAEDQLGVALLTRDPHFRLDDALAAFPRHLGPPITSTRGAVTATRHLRRVATDRVALVGDASGSVDAITGDGLSLAFRQAEALADALSAADLSLYEVAHRRLFRRPRFISAALLLLDRHPSLRRTMIRAFAAHPPVFARLLEAHTH